MPQGHRTPATNPAKDGYNTSQHEHVQAGYARCSRHIDGNQKPDCDYHRKDACYL